MYQGVEAYPRWGPASLLIHMEGAGFEPSVPLEVLAVSGSSLVVSADLSTLPLPKTKFAADSALEQAGFEPSVPC
jgi:hypothetical protein